MFMSASETESSRGPRQEPMDLDQEEWYDPLRDTVIPNRIFVSEIDSTIVENDLGRFFSEYGQVKGVKIMTNHSGLRRGYGFVSFETREDVQRLLKKVQNGRRVQFRDKDLYIAPAIKRKYKRRQRSYEGHTRSYSPSTPVPVAPPPVPCPDGPAYLITPDGVPYTCHNGVAYFQMPEEDIQSAHHWPSCSGTHHAYPPVILSPPPQFAPPHPAYHYYQEQTVQVVYQGIHPMPVPHTMARRFSHKHRAYLV